MRLLQSSVHPDIDKHSPSQFTRMAVRAIVLRGEEILLLYTERYHDYSLPGGGVDEGEALEAALTRELLEETGAHTIEDVSPFGEYEEYRPWYKADYEVMHMRSFCFTCRIAEELKAPQLEDYEQSNGMRPLWINIHQAIVHNEATMAHSEKQGMSIARETWLLKRIVAELL